MLMFPLAGRYCMFHTKPVTLAVNFPYKRLYFIYIYTLPKNQGPSRHPLHACGMKPSCGVQGALFSVASGALAPLVPLVDHEYADR